jgi:hypothetical protein
MWTSELVAQDYAPLNPSARVLEAERWWRMSMPGPQLPIDKQKLA